MNVTGELSVNGPIGGRGTTISNLTTNGVARMNGNVEIFGKTIVKNRFLIERPVNPNFLLTTLEGTPEYAPGRFQGIHMTNAQLYDGQKAFQPDVHLVASSSFFGFAGRINGFSGVLNNSGVSGLILNASYYPVGTIGSKGAIHNDAIITAFHNNDAERALIYGDGDMGIHGYLTQGISDIRLKTIISPITGSLDKINQISGFYYIHNEIAKKCGITDTDIKIGVSAQEIEKVLPEIVTMAPFDIKYESGSIKSVSGENYKTVNYDKIIPLLIEGIKELSNKVDQLEKKISGSV